MVMVTHNHQPSDMRPSTVAAPSARLNPWSQAAMQGEGTETATSCKLRSPQGIQVEDVPGSGRRLYRPSGLSLHGSTTLVEQIGRGVNFSLERRRKRRQSRRALRCVAKRAAAAGGFDVVLVEHGGRCSRRAGYDGGEMVRRIPACAAP